MLCSLAFGQGTMASVWPEVGDAGQTLATANQTIGAGTLSTITGSLSAEEFNVDLADLYLIQIINPTLFSVSTGDASSLNLVQDPMVFLFDPMGVGVTMNDDAVGSQSFLGVGPPGDFGAGFYYLGISFAGVTPIDGIGADIFDAFGDQSVLSPSPLLDFIGAPLTPNTAIAGAYSLALMGVVAAGMPEPTTSFLILGAFISLLTARRGTGHIGLGTRDMQSPR